MRTLSVLLSSVLLLAGAARAEDDAKAVLEKAIKAHGGAEKLMKYKAGTMKSKGKVFMGGLEIEFTQDSMYMLPDKLKEVSEAEVAGMKIKSVTLVNGDKASLTVNGMEQDVKGLKGAIAEGIKQMEMGRLVPLRDKKYELSLVGESKVLDKPAVGIRVAAKGMKDVNLYFDKKSGLMVKFETRSTDLATQQEVTEERIISEYKTVDGMALPQKALVNRDGKKYMELTIEEAKYLEKLDEAEFKKE